MLSNEMLHKMDSPTLEKEIKSRRELMNQMVGTLYPSILADEIVQLCERFSELQFKEKRE